MHRAAGPDAVRRPQRAVDAAERGPRSVFRHRPECRETGLFAQFLEQTLRGEHDARGARAREMFARVAGFPSIKTLDASTSVSSPACRARDQDLASLASIERAENISGD
jgi:hypothetical protein